MPVSSLDILVPAMPFLGGAAGAGLQILKRRLRPTPPTPNFQAMELPWTTVLADGVTVQTQQRTNFRVFDFAGVAYSGLTEERKDQLRQIRVDWLRTLSANPVDLRYFFARTKLHLPPTKAGEGFLGDMDRAWARYMENVYQNSHHVILSTTDGSLSRLGAASEGLHAELATYKPTTLSLAGGAQGSPLLTFLATLSGGFSTPIEPRATDINWVTGYHDVTWTANGRGRTFDGLTEKHWAVFSVRALPDYSTPALAEAIASIPGEVAFYIHAKPLDPGQTQATTRYRASQDNMFSKNFGGEIVKKEWAETANEVQARKEALYKAEMAFFLMADTEDALEDLMRNFKQILTTHFNKLVVETDFAQEWYAGRFPERDYFLRPWLLRASNLADWMTFVAEPRGHAACDWGVTPHRYIPTAGSRAPYGLTFHVSEAPQANPMFACYGSAGSGKTTAMMHIINGVLTAYPNARAWLFDQRNGLRVMVAAMGGEYLMPGTTDLPLNPFDTDDTPARRAMLETFLGILTDAKEDKDFKDISDAIEMTMNDDRSVRRFNERFLQNYVSPGHVRNALEKWIKSERYGHIFTGEQCAFNPSASRVMGIDMTLVRDDPKLAAALTYYYMRKMQDAVRDKKTPHVVWVDESSTLLQILQFAEQVEQLVRTARKDHGAIGFAFQEIGGLLRCPIANTLLVNVESHFIFPGAAANEDECRALNLTHAGAQFALGRAPRIPGASDYTVLLKRGEHEAYLDFNLAPLGNLLRFFAGGSGPVERMNECIKQYGPHAWRDPFANWH